MSNIEWNLFIKTVSEANCSEHWSKKHKRHSFQKKAIWAQFKKEGITIPLPCHVKLTRISSRKLDIGDNLPCAFKWIKDEIAAQITGNKVAGRGDDDERITWEYDQVKGSPQSIRISFTF
jgi:hypothetical protein